jgi:TRAP-type transport system small permease protein
MSTSIASLLSRPQRIAQALMAGALAVMALAVFLNVVLRYGFGMGIAASEELSRLLFVWMVFIGATAAYPLGEHMAFTSLLSPLASHKRIFISLSRAIHLLVVVTCIMIAWGAWQQVSIGWQNYSVVMGYPVALLPLPAFLCAVAIGVMAFNHFIRGKAISLGHESDVE